MGKIEEATYTNYNSGRTKPSRSSPEGDEDSCAFSTPCIPKRVDPNVDPSSPVMPINVQKAVPSPHKKMVFDSLPVRPHR